MIRSALVLGFSGCIAAALFSCDDGSRSKQASPPSQSPPGKTDTTSTDTSPTGAQTQAPVDTGPPAVQFIGRFDARDTAGPRCGWPGCRIVANFDGTAVSVRLNETLSDIGPSEWDVAIDGAWQTPHLILKGGDNNYDLAKDLPKGKHTVELYKRTEAQCGVTQFLGYDFHDGSLLPPPVRRQRKIEIIGDSDVTGFGYVGAITGSCDPPPVWAARFEDFRSAWGQRLADKLNAELYAPAFSGKGFYYNIWRPDTETIGVLYPRSDPNDPSSVWDFDSWQPDVVVVSIGGNDYNIGQPTDDGPAPLDKFTEAAREFTAMVRGHYPKAQIFLMAYAVLTDADPPGRQRRTNVEKALKTVRDEHLLAGDLHVYFTAPPQYDPAELTACDGHGGPQYHERIANFMADDISLKVGW